MAATVTLERKPSGRISGNMNNSGNMNSADKQYLARVAALGCIVCLNEGHGQTPPENTAIHHIRTGQGMGQRASHRDVLPLCPAHHQTGGYGVALHAGQEVWERRYGTEKELLAQVRAMLDMP